MKTKTSIVALVCFGFFALSCKKDDALKTTSYKQAPQLVISGYTAYDLWGNLVGLVDTSDWLSNAPIPFAVDSMFNTIPDNQNYTGVSDVFSLNGIFVYANPFKDAFNLQIEVSDVAVLKVLIVNEQLQVIGAVTTKLNSGNNTLTWALPSMPSYSLCRLYYKLYNNNKQVKNKGFGDIKKL